MRSKIDCILAALCICLHLFCVVIGKVRAGEFIELKAASPYPEQNITNYFLKYFAQELERETSGRVKITIYYAESLGKMQDFLNMLKSGICDIAIVATPVFKAAFPVLQVVDLPIESDSAELTTEILYELIKKGLTTKELSPYKLLWIHGNPPNMVYTQKRISKMEDLKGMKIRGPASTLEAIRALGATPITMPPPEVYMAMQRRVIDGFATALEFVVSARLYEVAKYLTWFPLGCGSHLTLMRLESWEKLPDEVQRAADQICSRHKEILFEELARRAENTPEKARSVGLEVVYLEPEEEQRWRDQLAPIIHKWVEEMESKGLPGKEAIQVVQEVIAKHRRK